MTFLDKMEKTIGEHAHFIRQAFNNLYNHVIYFKKILTAGLANKSQI